MEFNPARRSSSRRQRHQPRQDNSAYLGPAATSGTRSASYSNPLPQSEWAPSRQHHRSNRPSDSGREQDGDRYASDLSRYARSPVSPIDNRYQEERRESRRRNRRPRELRTNGGEDIPVQAALMDISLLYPQMNPYSDRRSTHSAPDEMEYFYARSNDHMDDVGYIELSSPSESTLTSIPRHSTFPPTTMRRTQTTTGVRDTTFVDQEEFSLFAQATSGLGPEEAFGLPLSQRSSYSHTERHSDVLTVSTRARPALSTHSSSPLPAAPTITAAIQQLEDLLHVPMPPVRQRRQPSLSDLDLHPWALQAASAGSEISSLEEDLEGIDDELPDYAQSQAQAQAHQRVEAARRAQELQRRWQLTGSRRPL